MSLEIWKFHEAPVEYQNMFPLCPKSKARWLLHLTPDMIEEACCLPFLSKNGVVGYTVERRLLIGTHHFLFLFLENSHEQTSDSRTTTYQI